MGKDHKVLGDKATTVTLLNGHSIKLLPTKFLALYPQDNSTFRPHQRSFFEQHTSINTETHDE